MINSLHDMKSIRSYLERIEAEPRSLRTAVIKQKRGSYWKDLHIIRIEKNGVVKAPPELMPTETEATLIAAECAVAIWPEMQLVHSVTNLPPMLSDAPEASIFEFRDESGMIVMLQQRIERKGEKSYIPWTYWSDNCWRAIEPENKLPLWGLDRLKNNTTVFVHEGAKAARRISNMILSKTKEDKATLADHPWGEELSHAAHVGWIGGALSPSRTDWSALMRQGVTRVYIVSDNDEPGVAAVSSIAFQLKIQTMHLQFTNEWPASFDLGDDFPEKMFHEIEGSRHYIGPSFRACVHPATWATDLVQIPNEGTKGGSKTVAVLRDSFKKMWAYVEEADVFVCIEMPEIVRSENVMNKMVAGFSHVKETGTIMLKHYKGRSTKLCYRPDNPGRIITDRTTSAINLHQRTTIKPRKGNTGPWLEFIEYLFPDKFDYETMMRWCATLIARPSVRMEFGVLLVSEAQGIGKTTLASKILAPLVGDSNVGFPTEKEIVDSNFNGWMANKRLIVIGEIYSGHSWKAYNTLKSYITDKDMEVNQKYMRPYRVENWTHMIACSNSKRALRMEESDRRWFYPRVTEMSWQPSKFAEFNDWLNNGGLQIIYDWALHFGKYVSVGERAPSTALKQMLIHDSRSDAMQEFSDFLEAVNLENRAVFCGMKEIIHWLRTRVEGKVFEKESELRKFAGALGWETWPERVKIGSQLQSVIGSPEGFAVFSSSGLEKGTISDEVRSKMRKLLINPGNTDISSL